MIIRYIKNKIEMRRRSKELEEVWSEVTEKIIIKGIENAFKPQTRYGKDYLKG